MANLAIKGHPTRGKEIIEILQMFGGINKYNITYTEDNLWYCLRSKDNVIIATYPNSSIKTVLSIEEFLEKFPYKVGDKVIIEKYYGQIFEILSARWCNERNVIMYQTSNGWYYTNELQPYKKENMEDIIKIDIPKGYEFAGVDNQQVVFEKIDYQYPKTYEECCEVLFPTTIELGKVSAHGYNGKLLEKFGELIICRNAYWKIAGEEMKLGKPWSPSKSDSVYCIFRYKGDIVKDNFVFGDSLILEFPTEEMRDAFFENFRHLIEICKELL